MATSGCSARMYSARWLPANPVIPVMRTRIGRQISKDRAFARLLHPEEEGGGGSYLSADRPPHLLNLVCNDQVTAWSLRRYAPGAEEERRRGPVQTLLGHAHW